MDSLVGLGFLIVEVSTNRHASLGGTPLDE
jgi:hypothetical protein